MGVAKGRLVYSPGVTFLDRAISLARAGDALRRVIVVSSETTAPGVPPEVDTVINPTPERGMFSSIQMGVREAGGGSVLLLMVDHPLVRARTITTLLAGSGEASTVPSYSGVAGHPVVLSEAAVQRVISAPADARLDQLLTDVLVMPVGDPGVVRNINTPERYAWFFGPLEVG